MIGALKQVEAGRKVEEVVREGWVGGASGGSESGHVERQIRVGTDSASIRKAPLVLASYAVVLPLGVDVPTGTLFQNSVRLSLP
jgi:hypothetical protein